MKHLLYLTCLSVLFITCREQGPVKEIQLKEIPTHCREGGEPNLFVAENGDIYLSWIEYADDTTDILMFSVLKNGQWDEPKEIARGSDWFVNWADFPSLSAFKNGQNLAVHWLQKSAAGTFDYDVRIAQSGDGGNTWAPSFIPHRDGIPAEHGFVTMVPVSEDRIFATWLDGRNTKNSKPPAVGSRQSEHEHGHGGAMTLRTAEFDREGSLFEEFELDDRICDCCQTDATMTPTCPVVVYRDRSEDEIRDISIVRKVNGKWTVPQTLHADNWKIAGCPVNGPVIASEGNFLAVAWFTAPEGKASVKIAFSRDGGATFDPPIRVDDGNPIGRVDVVLISEKEALVSWLENTDGNAEIRAAKVSPGGKIGESVLLVKTSPSRASGFPILEKMDSGFLLAWTQVDSIHSKIKTAFLDSF